MRSVRAFIAIELSEDIREALNGLSQRLRGEQVKVSWVKPENFHLTLRFLGEVDAARLEEMSEALAKAYKALNPFRLIVRGTGVFANSRRPKALWVGAEAPCEGLQELQSIAEEAAGKIGIAPNNKPFRPHITLARIRDPLGVVGLLARVDAEQEFEAGAFTVRGVSLFSSRLTPHGAVYTRVREFPF